MQEPEGSSAATVRKGEGAEDPAGCEAAARRKRTAQQPGRPLFSAGWNKAMR